MSPTIPILSALLLSLISGSAEGGQRMDPVALLRQTLRYWRKIYKTYHEEVNLGYCWADYLLEISDELSTNLSASSLAATEDHSNTTVGATKSQQNPFPQNVMADTTTTLREMRTRKHSRDKRSHATTSSIIPKFINYPDHRRITSTSKIIRKQKKLMMNKAGRALEIIIPNNVRESNNSDEMITLMNDSYVQKRRQTVTTIAPELFHIERETPRGHKFSSNRTSSRFNPTPNPGDDDKVSSGSTNHEENTRRKVLRSTKSDRDAFVEDTFGSRSFSLKVFRERRRSLSGHRFPFRWHSSHERNSRVDEPLPDPGKLKEAHEMNRDPEGRGVPLNNDGSCSMPSHLLFQQDAKRRMSVVKLIDSKENSSCDPAWTINSKNPRWKYEKLSRDSLLWPRRVKEVAIRRLPLKSQESGREAIKKNVFSRSETFRGSDTRKRRYRRLRREKRSRTGRNVSAASRTIHPIFLSGLERLRQQMPHENREFSSEATIPVEESGRDDKSIRSARSTSSLSPNELFTDDYNDSMNRSAQNSRSTALQVPQNQDQLSIVQQTSFVSNLRSVIIAVLRTLGMFVQVGRQIIDVVESNTALACTKEYLWIKIVRWIDVQN